MAGLRASAVGVFLMTGTDQVIETLFRIQCAYVFWHATPWGLVIRTFQRNSSSRSTEEIMMEAGGHSETSPDYTASCPRGLLPSSERSFRPQIGSAREFIMLRKNVVMCGPVLERSTSAALGCSAVLSNKGIRSLDRCFTPDGRRRYVVGSGATLYGGRVNKITFLQLE